MYCPSPSLLFFTVKKFCCIGCYSHHHNLNINFELILPNILCRNVRLYINEKTLRLAHRHVSQSKSSFECFLVGSISVDSREFHIWLLLTYTEAVLLETIGSFGHHLEDMKCWPFPMPENLFYFTYRNINSKFQKKFIE